MERAHWLSRKRASLGMAERAVSSRARLVHYELAGLYSVKAAEVPRPELHLEDEPPPVINGERKEVPSSPAERT
jgi:hypothetical protein